MGGMQHGGRRRLVDLAALDADQPVLDVVDPAHAVLSGERRDSFDQLDRRQEFAVEGNRNAALELDRDLRRLGGFGGIRGPGVDIIRRRDPGILEDTGFDRAPPQVDIDRVRRTLGDWDLDTALRRVVDLLLARQAHPDPHRGDHLQARVQGVDRDVEADLVVALAGTAMRH